MLVGSLTAWPPLPPNGPLHSEGTFLGCDYVSATGRHPSHLLLNVRYADKDYTLVYWHSSESILLRLMASLRHLGGMRMQKTGEVELLELKPLTY